MLLLLVVVVVYIISLLSGQGTLWLAVSDPLSEIYTTILIIIWLIIVHYY